MGARGWGGWGLGVVGSRERAREGRIDRSRMKDCGTNAVRLRAGRMAKEGGRKGRGVRRRASHTSYPERSREGGLRSSNTRFRARWCDKEL